MKKGILIIGILFLGVAITFLILWLKEKKKNNNPFLGLSQKEREQNNYKECKNGFIPNTNECWDNLISSRTFTNCPTKCKETEICIKGACVEKDITKNVLYYN